MLGFDALGLLWRVLLCLVLTFLPCFAVCSFAISKGVRSAIWLNLLALAQIGVVGYLAFWLWLASPILGWVFTFCLPIASARYLLCFLRRSDTTDRNSLKLVVLPAAITGISALLVLSAGFLYGGFDDPLATARIRFSHPLPLDNQLPYWFALGLVRDHVPSPLYIDWLSSDRPPLQTGIYLSQFAYLGDEKGYEVLSALIQSLWIYALYIFLSSFRLNLRVIRLVLITCLFSGFVFLNTLYVWPKLVAGAYFTAFAALLLSPQLMLDLRNNKAIAILGGALLALALLCHGGSAFSVLGIGLTVLLLRPRTLFSKRFLIVLVSCFCLYLPWTLYQKFYDPPGDRLLKYHLADVQPVTSASFGQTVVKAYRSLPVSQIVSYKLSNFGTVLDHNSEYRSQMCIFLSHFYRRSHEDQEIAGRAAHDLRGSMFFYFVPSLGFLVLGPFALLIGISKRFRSLEWRCAAILYICVGLTVIVWCLLMFGPAKTVIHQGSYAANLMALSGSVLALWAVSSWLARIVAALQITLNFLLYGVFMDTAFSVQPPQLDVLALFLLALLALFLVMSQVRPNHEHELHDTKIPAMQST